MLKFNKKKLFLVMLILSSIMVMSSSSWLSMWMGMEINLMMNIPFLFKNKSKTLSEKIMIYFLIQVMGSIIMLTMILIKNMNFNQELSIMFISMSMMIKLGLPPFHIWMPEMLNKLEWETMMVMISIQKINPMIMLTQFMNQNMISMMIMIMAASIGSLGGINQLSLNKIIAFSSINHMSWIIMLMLIMTNLWMKYFIVYTMINLTLCLTFKKMNTMYINQLSVNTNLYSKMMLLLMMMNLGGFPPMPGFLLKWLTMEWMISMNMKIIMTIMIFSSMITLLFYMRSMFSNTMMSTMNFKFKMIKFNKKMHLMFYLNMLTPMILMI
uniref:NADH-ubiquinone oxidoreductase chain 2 n=1 Tax=Agramma hupehanum TaxID=1964413 RepID=A0A343BT53_9HEMI|nr:NADH dehydrogenase subunit 2 [Agramma hupehanum]ARB50118.1 NADH dehydrogenase subunit 2 [Agramma hupehanum]